MKPLALIIFLLFFFLQTNAQDNSNSIQIAIIPFSSSGGDASIVQAVQEQVTSNFANKNRFILLDRSKTDKIKKELDAAKDNSSIYAKIVAEQGHLAGAEYIITGVVSPLEIQESQIVSTIKKIQTTTNQYHGTIRLSLQINKVETGQVIFSQPLTVVSIDYTTRNQSDIVDNILCKLRNIVQSEVRRGARQNAVF
jgi:curli biogenesis system outer membrane secretion channel CsgG